MNFDKLSDAISVIGDITTILRAIIDATKSAQHTDLKTILPETLLTSLAKTAADLRAKEKFDSE